VSVRLAILALLDEGPRHGYQLRAEFDARTGAVWPLNVGQVYTTLDRLERDGLIVPVGGTNGARNQRAFAITDAGRSALAAWLVATEPGEVPRDELLVKVLVVAARDPQAALGVISAQRTGLFARLQAHRRTATTGDLAAELVHDVLAVRAEADLRWLDRCEARLRQVQEASTNGAAAHPRR
jgi:DNA-binding PadR family transcriptional regulator